MSTATAAGTSTASRLRLVVGRLHRRLRTEGGSDLSPLLLSALVTIEGHGPLRLGELAAREAVSAPTMSRALAALDERGVVTRTPDPADARSVLLTLSPEGERVLAEVRATYTATLQRRLDRLDPAQRHALEDALPALEALLAD
ncbi:DNA-binding MarR family transcriptional regulator [Motilibacter rhizosphaerae]|uniref:DNA-binding MarR family transcriptional regulator n=1 Tax=Motilibacter rhizosphaerae TaxID=598652 RepID=A0A4Q7NTF2_9ACTN|nr:MarR family transcriptional regulator [Motilibacter rhizosphaerae]RZS90355.1 DNA-binding MarR family transcriptional regulator [Motilibacter rhizosphaerae]